MAESLTFAIGADTKGFQDGIGGLLGKLAGLVAAFVSAQAVIEAFGAAIDLGGRLHDLSTRTGETAGNLAVLERAFDNTSVGAEKLGPSIARMQKSITELATDSEAANNAFTQLGLKFSDLEGKSPAEQLQLIGQRLAALSDDGTRAATAMAIFGKSGAELLPILTNFASETAQAKTQLGSLPDILNETAATVDSLGDNLSAIKNKGTEMAYGFLSEVVPAIEKFTSKLSGLDAAGVGAGLADALIGAFVNPMKAAELLGQSLSLGAKTMGNELVFQIRYWSEILLNTFSAVGTNIIPMLGNNMLGALEVAAGGFGEALLSVISGALESLTGVAGALGFGDELQSAIDTVNGLKTDANQMMVDGFAKISESAAKFEQAFESARANSTVVREDIFGAGETSAKIAADFEAIKEVGEGFLGAFDSAEAAEGRTTSGSDTTLLDTITALDSVSKATVVFGDSANDAAKKVAAATKAMDAQIKLLAGINPLQGIGPSASARAAEDLDRQINELVAAGEDPNGSRIQNLKQQRDRHRDIATGVALTEADREAARDYARDNLADSDKSFDELYEEALKNIEERKREEKGLPPKEEEDKKKQQEDTKKPEEEEKAKTPAQVMQQLLQLLQKIEPRIPVANLVG